MPWQYTAIVCHAQPVKVFTQPVDSDHGRGDVGQLCSASQNHPFNFLLRKTGLVDYLPITGVDRPQKPQGALASLGQGSGSQQGITACEWVPLKPNDVPLATYLENLLHEESLISA
jgi:hypothetical protein